MNVSIAFIYSFSGLYSGRKSVGNSPSKMSYNSKNQSPNNTLYQLKQTLQLSGSTNELRPRRSGLPASKLRQYSSHKELNRIPGTIYAYTIIYIYYIYKHINIIIFRRSVSLDR